MLVDFIESLQDLFLPPTSHFERASLFLFEKSKITASLLITLPNNASDRHIIIPSQSDTQAAFFVCSLKLVTYEIGATPGAKEPTGQDQ